MKAIHMNGSQWRPIYLLYALFLLSSISSIAQGNNGNEAYDQQLLFLQNKMVVPPSAEAASLGKYGEYEVNTYTGSPNIGLPIYTIKGNEIMADVSLQYNSGGNKVSEFPTWVGLGWALNSGGSISRAVKGEADLKYNYFDHAQEIIDHVTINPDSYDEYDFRYQVAKGNIETQPDNFYFNFNGRAGKFFIDPEKNLIQKEYSDLKITPTFDANDDITGFEVLDEKGTKYVFAAPERTFINYDDVVSQSGLTRDVFSTEFNSAWYLTEISSKNNNEKIHFTYTTETTPYALPIHYKQYESQLYKACNPNCASGDTPPSGTLSLGGPSSDSRIEDKKYLATIELKISGNVAETLTFTTDDVTCTHSQDTDKQLDKIALSRLGGAALLNWDFDYDCSTGRLTLLSLQETSAIDAAVVKPAHTFEYYTGYTLPAYTSTSMDHWGYYNGVSGNTLLPTYNLNTNAFNDANRAADPIKMKAGILEKITYPTGGYTEFDFEANDRTNTQTATQYVPISYFGNQAITHESCAGNLSDCCELINGAPDTNVKIQSVNINAEMLDGYLNITAENVCDTGGPLEFMPTEFIGFEIEILSLDEATSYGSYFHTEATDNYQNRIKFDDEFTVPTTGSYKIKITGYESRVEIVWEKLATLTFSTTEIIGGLRIADIKSFDSNGDLELHRGYNYVNAGGSTSSGKLFAEPDYFQIGSYSNYPILMFGGGPACAEYTCATYTVSTSSITELGTVQGSSIGYSRVEEVLLNDAGISNTEGKIVYHFYNNGFQSDGGALDPVKNGQLSKKEVLDKDDLIITETTYNYAFEDNSHKRGEVFYGYAIAPKSDQDNRYFMYLDNTSDTYVWTEEANDIAGIDHRVYKTKLEQKDYKRYEQYYMHPTGEITTNYFYDNGTFLNTVSTEKTYKYESPDHLQITEESTVNSDGKTHTTKYKYTYDNPVGIYSSMIAKNILEPLEVWNDVDGIRVDGTKTDWGGFGFSIYPWKTWRWEMSWNSSGQVISDDWELQTTIEQYSFSTGKPTQITRDGWNNSIYYSWSNTGKLLEASFIDFKNTFDYFPDTDLLQKTTNINGTSASYAYDDLLRLVTATDDQRSIIARTDYNYATLGGGNNYIRTSTDYPDLGGVPRTLIAENQFDGLGRTVSSIQKNRGPDGIGDAITSTDYDGLGRVSTVTDPLGGVTSYTYYPDPLGRTQTLTPPDWFATSTAYQVNAAEVAGYSAGELYKQISRDPDGLENIVYTDKLGRTVLSRTGVTGNYADTYTSYDDKNRATTVTPPDAIGQAGLLFQYTYDGADNLLTKKVPDQALMTYQYDNRDLQIASKDGNIEALKGWLNTEYDNYGRPFKVGFGSTAGTITETLIENFYDNVDAQNTVNTASPIYTGQMHKSEVAILNGFDAGGTSLITNYTLDAFGRIEEESGNNHLNGTRTINYTYDLADNIRTCTKLNNGISAVTSYDYDPIGRAEKMWMSVNGSPQQLIAEYDYTFKDEQDKKTLGGGLQEVDYTYNAQGWLTNINAALPGGIALPVCPTTSTTLPTGETGNAANPLFSLSLHYNTANTTLDAPARKNGSIAAIDWQVRGREMQSYGFQYDDFNRLTQATSTDNGAFNTNYEYADKRGNLKKITRNGLVTNEACMEVALIDDIIINYQNGTNQVSSISDAANPGGCPDYLYVPGPVSQSGTYSAGIEVSSDGEVLPDKDVDFIGGNNIRMTAGFKFSSDGVNGRFSALIGDCTSGNPTTGNPAEYGFIANAASGQTYGYDANGNTTDDPNKGFTFQYNHLNLPYEAAKDANNKIQWIYTADGKKLSKKVSIDGTAQPSKDYLGEIELTGGQLEAVYHKEGRVSSSGGSLQWEYKITDHLGNTRLLFADKDGNGSITVSNNPASNEILQESHYYPFGMTLNGSWMKDNNTKNDYLYNGKELNNDLALGLMDYGARFYDPSIGRFTAVDPLAEQYSAWSPYHYTYDNPVMFTDPDGRSIIKGAKALFNVGKRAYKTYKKTGKVNLKSVGNALKDEALDIIDTAATLFDSEASVGEKALAVFDLATGFGDEAKGALTLFKDGGTRGGKRAGKNITKKTKRKAKAENIELNGGFKCQDCKVDLVDSKKSERGVKTASNEAQYDHIDPKAKGGDGSIENTQVLCASCNRKKSDTSPDEYYNKNK